MKQAFLALACVALAATPSINAQSPTCTPSNGLNFICGLAGYHSCSALSTFEAIILAAVTLAVCAFGLGILLAATMSAR